MTPLTILLLMTAGPILLGFTDLLEDNAEAADETTAPEPVDTDLVARLDDARSQSGDSGPVNALRGTDADETMTGIDSASNFFDASGGADTVTGAMQNDTLAGGEGSDTIMGGAGDDVLFGGFVRETRPDDMDADSLDGGSGDDTFLLGAGDIGTGGYGADIFATVQDAVGTITITDFDPAEDALVIETADAGSVTIAQQTVGTAGLTLTLSTGLSIMLEGVDTELDAMDVNFITVEPLASA